MTEPILSPRQWATCAALLSGACGRPLAAEQMEAYYSMLNDIPVDALQVACKRAVQSEETTWIPSIGLIRKYAAEAVHGVLPTAIEAWLAINAVELSYSPVGFWDEKPPLEQRLEKLPEFIGRVYRAIGGRMDEKLFLKTYETMAKQEMEMRKVSPSVRPAITAERAITSRLQDRRQQRIGTALPSGEKN